jgi:hypothetical protein
VDQVDFYLKVLKKFAIFPKFNNRQNHYIASHHTYAMCLFYLMLTDTLETVSRLIWIFINEGNDRLREFKNIRYLPTYLFLRRKGTGRYFLVLLFLQIKFQRKQIYAIFLQDRDKYIDNFEFAFCARVDK